MGLHGPGRVAATVKIEYGTIIGAIRSAHPFGIYSVHTHRLINDAMRERMMSSDFVILGAQFRQPAKLHNSGTPVAPR